MFSLTNRFKIPVPDLENTDWLDYLTHWANLNDVMLTVLANKDYVISGLAVATSPTSLNFTYSAGSLSINSSQVDITGGNGSLTASTFNWIYVQNSVVKISTYPPSGVTYVPLACVQTTATGVAGAADLRPSPTTVNGISITPTQVNPTSNINIAAGKRVLQADSNVGSNIVMLSNAESQLVLNWGNQTTAKAWTEVDLSTKVSANAKFAILNCYIATLNAVSNGWAVLEVKTGVSYDDYAYNFVDYGHPSANVLNSNQRGQVNQITLPIDVNKKFRARSLINSLGGSGKYYASIRIVGYVS